MKGFILNGLLFLRGKGGFLVKQFKFVRENGFIVGALFLALK